MLLKSKGVRFTNIQLEQSMFNNNSGIIVLFTKHKSPVGISVSNTKEETLFVFTLPDAEHTDPARLASL